MNQAKRLKKRFDRENRKNKGASTQRRIDKKNAEIRQRREYDRQAGHIRLIGVNSPEDIHALIVRQLFQFGDLG